MENEGELEGLATQITPRKSQAGLNGKNGHKKKRAEKKDEKFLWIPLLPLPTPTPTTMAPRPFPQSTIDAISRSRRRRQALRSSQHPFPPLLPLRNSIHPLFHPDRFPMLAPYLYETLAPALRLATMFLTAEGMLDWWVPLLLSPLPSLHTTTGAETKTKTRAKPKDRRASCLRLRIPTTLAAIPVTQESLRHTESLLAAHADSVEFRFVAVSKEEAMAAATAPDDGAGAMDGAFASTHQDPRPGREGKAVVVLGEGWLEGVVEEWQPRDGGRRCEDSRVRIENKDVKLEEEEGRKLRVRVALAILLVHEVAHSVWVVRNATVACKTATKSPQVPPLYLIPDPLPPKLPITLPATTLSSTPNHILLEPYHHALESVAELGCSWEAFALSGGRIQPINLSTRCEDGLCWFAWPEPPSLKRRPQQLVPPDRDMSPRYATHDRERADGSRAQNETPAVEYEKERNKERFWGVSMGWVREVCDRDKWDWVELFGRQELRVRLLGQEGDGSGATCPFSSDGWRERKRREKKTDRHGGGERNLVQKKTAV